MNNMTKRGFFVLLVLGTLVFAGCRGPVTKPSPLMKPTAAPVGPPVAGKSAVMIHRPRAAQGYGLYTGVWDSTNFLADLGNGHSVAYLCEPGTHYLINRSVERVGVVEAQLLPDQTYDLWLDTCGGFIASFQLEPIKSGDKKRRDVPEWTRENLWLTRAPAAAAHEQQRQRDIQIILMDFTSGEKKDRVRHLTVEDHR